MGGGQWVHYSSFIGKKTETVSIIIPRNIVREYAETVGLSLDIYTDVEKAREAGYPDLVLPATYPVLFWRYVKIPWLDLNLPLIHGKQSFSYNEPLVANQTYDCFIQLTDVSEKEKGNFLLQFLTHRLVITKNGDEAATATSVLILKNEKK